MRFVMNGIVYDTNEAVLIKDYYVSGTPSQRGPQWLREKLYITPSNNFFLYCQGGSQTKYGIKIGGAKPRRGTHITPLKKEEVKEWLKLHFQELVPIMFPETENTTTDDIVSEDEDDDWYEED